jgi:hypothetical protein
MAAFLLRICGALPESIRRHFAREPLTQPGRERGLRLVVMRRVLRS